MKQWYEMRDGEGIRKIELTLILKRWRNRFKSPLLELGSGDGTQYRRLKRTLEIVIPSDLSTSKWPKENGKIINMNAEKLPYKSNSFTTVFSSNVLEHINNIEDSLKEIYRVLRDDGYMVHTLPTVIWKLLQMGLYHPALLRKWILTRERPPFIPNLIHGVSKNSLKEIIAFKHKTYKKLFNENGFTIIDFINLCVYSEYRFFPNILGLRCFLAKFGLSSCRAYLLKKTI